MSLILHKGAISATRDEVRAVPTPSSTNTWQAVPHIDAIECVSEHASFAGLELHSEHYGMAPRGNRFFGVMVFKSKYDDGFRPSIGIRNSHDKSIALGLTVGSQVMVCDNLLFGGDYTATRRHFSHLVIEDTVTEFFEVCNDKYGALLSKLYETQHMPLALQDAKSLLFDMARDKIVRMHDANLIYQEYEKPLHKEFAEYTRYNFAMAITEVAKGFALAKYQRLHAYLPTLIGY